MEQKGIERIHRPTRGKTYPVPCRKWWCPRPHNWIARCVCGWTSIYRQRWQAERMLNTFHQEEAHGEAED